MEKRHEGPELLADEVAQKIRAKIQNQQYQPGDRLTVRLLCEEFGTSAGCNGSCGIHTKVRHEGADL